MSKIKDVLNIVVFVFLVSFIGFELWILVSHFLKTPT